MGYAWRFREFWVLMCTVSLSYYLSTWRAGLGSDVFLISESGLFWIIQLATLHPRSGFSSPSQHSDSPGSDSSSVHIKPIYTKCRIISVCFLNLFLTWNLINLFSTCVTITWMHLDYIETRDAPNFWPPEICDDANKKRGKHMLVWISANMSAVWTFFNVSKKDPHIVICKNCNALILMKLVHSHRHKCNGTRVVLTSINGITFETRSTAIFSVNSPLTLGDSVWQRANSGWQRLITFYI